MPAIVNADLFRIAASFISTEESRYYLRGVLIQRHQLVGINLVATDGHRMIVIHDENGTTSLEDVIVQLDKVALTACKPVRRETGERMLIVDGDGRAQIMSGDAEPLLAAINHRAVIDGTFPDWRHIASPRTDAPSPATFDGQYLADFGKASKDLSKTKVGAIRLIGAADEAALVRFRNVAHAFGVLMPIRDDCDNKTPWFLNAAPGEMPIAAE